MPALHTIDPLAPEREKYAAIWEHPEYREHSPGLENVARFMDILQPPRGHTLIDIGCGEGKAGLIFQDHKLFVNWLDLVNVLDPDVPRARFIQAPIWSQSWTRSKGVGWDFGFCCDVMEHLPTEFVMLALERVISACRTSWFQIAFEPDNFGGMIGDTLHLTVKPFDWWRDRLALLGRITEARDLCGSGVFVVSR